MIHHDSQLEQHPEVERAQHRAARVIVLSSIVIVTLALVVVGFVLWAAFNKPRFGEVTNAPRVPGLTLQTRRQPARPTRPGDATWAWAELEVDLTSPSSRLRARWAQAAWGRRLIFTTAHNNSKGARRGPRGGERITSALQHGGAA